MYQIMSVSFQFGPTYFTNVYPVLWSTLFVVVDSLDETLRDSELLRRDDRYADQFSPAP